MFKKQYSLSWQDGSMGKGICNEPDDLSTCMHTHTQKIMNKYNKEKLTEFYNFLTTPKRPFTHTANTPQMILYVLGLILTLIFLKVSIYHTLCFEKKKSLIY